MVSTFWTFLQFFAIVSSFGARGHAVAGRQLRRMMTRFLHFDQS
jgi:hypothetical protein